MAMVIKSPSLKRVDLFRIKEEDVSGDTASAYSLFGTCAAIGLLIFFSAQQLITLSKHQATVSRSFAPGSQPGLRAEIVPFGLIAFRDGEGVFNESIFKWEFKYRAIFHGDTRNDEFPRQYYFLPSKECKTYFTIVPGEDPQPYTSRPYSTLESGKDALCLDWLAAKEQLEQEAAFGLSSTIQLEGRYGDPAYWFLEAELIPCSDYGAKDNITCATKEELDLFFTKEMSLDVASLDNPEPGTYKWTSHYFNFDSNTENSHEMFFKVIEHKDEDKFLPSFVGARVSQHVVYDSVFVRTRPRGDDDPYVNLFFRLSATVEEVEVAYFNLEDALEGIGAWYSILFFAFSVACLGPNLVLRLVGDAKHRLTQMRSSNADAPKDAYPEVDAESNLTPRSEASLNSLGEGKTAVV